MLSLGSGLSGVLRGPSWPELQLSKRAAGVNVPMVCAAEVLSLVSGWRPPVCEVSLVFWTGVFLSPGRRICVIGKETGPGPGGYR